MEQLLIDSLGSTPQGRVLVDAIAKVMASSTKDSQHLPKSQRSFPSQVSVRSIKLEKDEEVILIDSDDDTKPELPDLVKLNARFSHKKTKAKVDVYSSSDEFTSPKRKRSTSNEVPLAKPSLKYTTEIHQGFDGVRSRLGRMRDYVPASHKKASKKLNSLVMKSRSEEQSHFRSEGRKVTKHFFLLSGPCSKAPNKKEKQKLISRDTNVLQVVHLFENMNPDTLKSKLKSCFLKLKGRFTIARSTQGMTLVNVPLTMEDLLKCRQDTLLYIVPISDLDRDADESDEVDSPEPLASNDGEPGPFRSADTEVQPNLDGGIRIVRVASGIHEDALSGRNALSIRSPVHPTTAPSSIPGVISTVNCQLQALRPISQKRPDIAARDVAAIQQGQGSSRYLARAINRATSIVIPSGVAIPPNDLLVDAQQRRRSLAALIHADTGHSTIAPAELPEACILPEAFTKTFTWSDLVQVADDVDRCDGIGKPGIDLYNCKELVLNLSEVLQCGIDFFKKHKPEKQYKVVIPEDDVVDGGGVRRNFLSDLAICIESKYMEGEVNRRLFVHTSDAAIDGTMRAVGNAIGSMIRNGLRFGSLCVVQAAYLHSGMDLVEGLPVEILLADMPPHIKKELEDILYHGSLNFDVLRDLDIDGGSCNSTAASKVPAACIEYLIHKRTGTLDKIKMGLDDYGITQMFRDYPLTISTILGIEVELSFESFRECLSVKRSSTVAERKVENHTFIAFLRALQDLEREHSNVCLSMLDFCTGSSKFVLTTGFRILVYFGSSDRILDVAVCVPSVTLPKVRGIDLQCNLLFMKDKINTALKNYTGFGCV